ncbi:MAG: hypothetical protein ACRCVI_01090 [Mycoplasmoidaceae bacterium]
MKKQIKKYFLIALLIGVTTSIVLPIVSCSSNNKVEKQEVTVNKAEAPVFNDLGLLLLKVANPVANDLNSSLTHEQFTKIVNTKYTEERHPEIFAKFKEAFKFGSIASKNEENFNQFVKDVLISGTYKNQGTKNVTLAITIELKEQYQAPLENLSQTIIIGTTYEPLTIEKGDATALNELGLEFAKIANPSATSNNEQMTSIQFDVIPKTQYDQDSNPVIWEKFNAYLSFRLPDDSSVSFLDAVTNVNITGTYPKKGVVNLEASLTLNSHFYTNTTFKEIIPIAVITQVNIARGTTEQAMAIGTAIAKIINPTTFSNQERITSDQFNQLVNKIYRQTTHPAIFQTLKQYFVLKDNANTILNFDDVIDGIHLSGTYPSTSQEVVVSLLLILNDGYSTSNPDDSSLLSQTIQIGNQLTTVGVSTGNEAALNALGTAFAKIAMPSINSNTSPLFKHQYEQIINTDITSSAGVGVRTALDNYLMFNRPNTNGTTIETGRIAFTDVFLNLTIDGVYLETPGTSFPIPLDLTVILKEGFTTVKTIKIGVQIGFTIA